MKPLKNDIVYQADIFQVMNEVNNKHQVNVITLANCKCVGTSFNAMLSLYKFPVKMLLLKMNG